MVLINDSCSLGLELDSGYLDLLIVVVIRLAAFSSCCFS